MSTAKAIIDVHNGKLTMTVLGETVEYDVLESMKHPMGALDCFGVQVNKESNPTLSLGNYEGLAEFPIDHHRTPLIRHESPYYEEIIARLKEENRSLQAMNFELTTKLEKALKDQDDLVDECTIRVSHIEEAALQRDQLMRDQEELKAKSAKGKKVDRLCNKPVDEGKKSKLVQLRSNPPPLQNQKAKIQGKKAPPSPTTKIERGKISSPSSIPPCVYCHKKGHTKPFCAKLNKKMGRLDVSPKKSIPNAILEERPPPSNLKWVERNNIIGIDRKDILWINREGVGYVALRPTLYIGD